MGYITWSQLAAVIILLQAGAAVDSGPLQSEARPRCWGSIFDVSRGYVDCCYYGRGDCWDAAGVFTPSRCCTQVVPPGDPACWNGAYTYQGCCMKHRRWFVERSGCFDYEYTFERCCGGHSGVAFFELRHRLAAVHAAFSTVRGPWLCFLVLSICARICKTETHIGGATGQGKCDMACMRRAVNVPAATSLRVLAMCGIVAVHSSALVGMRADGTTQDMRESEPLLNFASSLFVVHTDIFFVLSAYLSAVSVEQRKLPPAPSRAAQLQAAVLEAAAGVLRRVTRTAPTFLLAASLRTGSLEAFLRGLRTEDVLGVVWPFGVDLLCFMVVRMLLLLSAVAGEVVGGAVVISLLAACAERRRKAGPHLGGRHPLAPDVWHRGHLSMFGHRLPLALATLLLLRLLRLLRPVCGRHRGQVSSVYNYRPQCVHLGWAITWMMLWLGIIFAAVAEWCWVYGPRPLLPWWSYPFVVKLPLVLGCVLLLEESYRAAVVPQRGRGGSSPIFEALDKLSLGVLVLHWKVEDFVVLSVPFHDRSFVMLLFQMPAVLFWSCLAAALLQWVELPLRHLLDALLATLLAHARHQHNGRLTWLSYMAGAILFIVVAACARATVAHLCEPIGPATPCDV